MPTFCKQLQIGFGLRAGQLPSPSASIEVWRDEVRGQGQRRWAAGRQEESGPSGTGTKDTLPDGG